MVESESKIHSPGFGRSRESLEKCHPRVFQEAVQLLLSLQTSGRPPPHLLSISVTSGARLASRAGWKELRGCREQLFHIKA